MNYITAVLALTSSSSLSSSSAVSAAAIQVVEVDVDESDGGEGSVSIQHDNTNNNNVPRQQSSSSSSSSNNDQRRRLRRNDNIEGDSRGLNAAAAPGCGPTSGTHHSPYIGCYTDKISDRAFPYQLYADSPTKNKGHGALDCERECSSKGYRYIGREFKGQCFCGNKLEDIVRYGTDSGCDCCGYNVGANKMCVWENANHPQSQASAPNIPPVIPSLTQSAADQENMSVVTPLHPPLNNHATDIQNSIKNNFQNHINDYTPINSYVPPPKATNNQVASNNNNRPNSAQSKPSGGFRIRLHWQRGYNWQDSSSEKFYCLQCRGTCKSSSKLEIDTCRDYSIRQKFLAVGKTIRPASNPSLCVTITGYGGKSSPVQLKPCQRSYSASKTQRFNDVKANGKFELISNDRTGRCLSQHHHPKPHEVVFPEKCEKTRKFDTTYWIAY